jgi:hypothetical protein
MAVLRGAQPATHWSTWVLALVAAVLLVVGLSNLVRPRLAACARAAALTTAGERRRRLQCMTHTPSLQWCTPLPCSASLLPRRACYSPGLRVRAVVASFPGRFCPRTWVGSQYQLFQADWSKGGVHLLLNHSYFTAADIPAGFIPPRPTRIWLNVSDAAVSLKGRHVLDQAQYTQQQWFNVRESSGGGCAGLGADSVTPCSSAGHAAHLAVLEWPQRHVHDAQHRHLRLRGRQAGRH